MNLPVPLASLSINGKIADTPHGDRGWVINSQGRIDFPLRIVMKDFLGREFADTIDKSSERSKKLGYVIIQGTVSGAATGAEKPMEAAALLPRCPSSGCPRVAAARSRPVRVAAAGTRTRTRTA